MLKQDAVPAESSVPPVSVAQARVTPDELASALAVIEARRQAEAMRLAGTIPIEQAVSDLHLDSTPDEIWAEVQAQRAKVAVPQAQAAHPQVMERQQGRSQGRHRNWRGLLASVLVIGVLMSAGVIPQPWNHSDHTTVSIQHSAPPILHALASVPVGQEVYADDFALVQISQGKPLSQITVSQNLTGNRWPVVKEDDHHIYVRGYIESADSLSDLQGKPLNIYNDDNSGELHGDRTSNITLRLDNIPFQKSSGTDAFSGISISHFQPSSFTTLTPGR